MEESNTQKAYDYAIFLLGIRLRTEGEIREKLRNKPVRGGSAFGGNYNDKVIDEVIKQLKDLRYIDDQRYAEVFLDNLKKYKNFGYYGIKKKMMEKRLSSNIIENVLSEGLNEEEEIKIARRFIKKQEVSSKYQAKESKTLDRSSQFDRDSPVMKEKQRLAQKLKSRGFRGSVIAKLLF